MHGCFLCPKWYLEMHFKDCRSTGLEMIPKLLALRMSSCTAKTLVVICNCMTKCSSWMNIYMQTTARRAQVARIQRLFSFFNSVYIGLTTCGSLATLRMFSLHPVRCWDGCHWETTLYKAISSLVQDLLNSKSPVDEPACSSRDWGCGHERGVYGMQVEKESPGLL